MSLRQTLGRAVGAALTVALIGLAVPGQAVAAPAPTHDARTVPVAGAERAAAAKPSRTITLEGREIRRTDRFEIAGTVFPRYAERLVIVDRKLGKGGWTLYKKVRTSGKSRYRTGVAPRRDVGTVSYRVRTAGTAAYAPSFSDHLYVITTKRG